MQTSVLLQSDHHRVNAAIIQMRLNCQVRRQRLRAELKMYGCSCCHTGRNHRNLSHPWKHHYGVIDRTLPKLLDRHCACCSGDNGSCRIVSGT